MEKYLGMEAALFWKGRREDLEEAISEADLPLGEGPRHPTLVTQCETSLSRVGTGRSAEFRVGAEGVALGPWCRGLPTRCGRIPEEEVSPPYSPIQIRGSVSSIWHRNHCSLHGSHFPLRGSFGRRQTLLFRFFFFFLIDYFFRAV